MPGSVSFQRVMKSALGGLGACRNADGAAQASELGGLAIPGIRDLSTGRRPMGFHSLS